MNLYNQRTSLQGIFLALLYFVLSVCGFVVNHAVPSSSPQVSFATIRPSTSTTFLSMATNNDVIPSRQFIFEGMEAFRQGDVVKSIEKFDASVPPGTSAYLWQRGLSYYYNDEFEKGSKQFRDDVLRSPLDVEEIVWDIACLLRMDSSKFPHPNQLSLPKGKKDRRPIMGTVYSLFRGEASEEDLAKAGHSGGPGDEFYALLYLGLFNEAMGETFKAENYMKSAVKTKYAQVVGSKDYMVDVARVHCQLRHWTV